MSLRAAIPLPEDQIAEVCRRHGVRELAVFGSVLREDFRPDSDVDLLVAFVPERRIGYFGLFRIQDELESVIGRPVDLVPRDGLNPAIRDSVLREAKTICVV